MEEGKTRWKDKTARVIIHVTPEGKRQWNELVKAMGGSKNIQNDFEEFMKSKVHMTGLSDLKKRFLSLKEQQVQRGKEIGKERIVVLTRVYNNMGGDNRGGLHDYQQVCERMLKEWCPKQPEPSRAISEVIEFEAFVRVNKLRAEAERELLGQVDATGGAGTAPPV